MSPTWLAGHKQRVAYSLIAVLMTVLVAAATAGGIFLHGAADLERQTQRTQQLGGLAFQLQDVASRAQTAGGVNPALAADRTRALEAADAALRLVGKHDRAAGERLRAPYDAYVRSSKRALDAAAANGGAIPGSVQRQVEQELTRLEARVDAEVRLQERQARVTNPRARLGLIVAAVAAGLLVAVLFLQFETERRAGRIDLTWSSSNRRPWTGRRLTRRTSRSSNGMPSACCGS
jgi:hypothetical protein